MELALVNRFRAIALEHAGIALSEGKAALLEARIGERLRALGLPDAGSYLKLLEEDASRDELVQFIDAVSTNLTSFFREPEHFELLAEEAATWRREKRTKIRVWCAAASSGEEPYTLAMTLADAFAGEVVDWRVLGTDISTRALAKAEAGVYSGQRVEAIPKAARLRHFERQMQAGTVVWSVRPELRKRVVFRRVNLAAPPYFLSGPIDAVFCRNVMIYFATPTRQALVSEVERVLRPDGLFIIGHAETLTGIRSSFRQLRASVFRVVP